MAGNEKSASSFGGQIRSWSQQIPEWRAPFVAVDLSFGALGDVCQVAALAASLVALFQEIWGQGKVHQWPLRERRLWGLHCSPWSNEWLGKKGNSSWRVTPHDLIMLAIWLFRQWLVRNLGDSDVGDVMVREWSHQRWGDNLNLFSHIRRCSGVDSRGWVQFEADLCQIYWMEWFMR